MSAFTGPLTLTHLDADWRRWRLEQPLVYEVGSLGSGDRVVVPAGFVTDGATIPRVLWVVLPVWARWSRAAIVHDWLYSLIRGASAQARSRREADAIFYEAMKVSGVNSTIRFFMWLAVRAAGRATVEQRQ